MLKLNYFLADIFILSAEKQPIKLSWRKIEWLLEYQKNELKNEVKLRKRSRIFAKKQSVSVKEATVSPRITTN